MHILQKATETNTDTKSDRQTDGETQADIHSQTLKELEPCFGLLFEINEYHELTFVEFVKSQYHKNVGSVYFTLVMLVNATKWC